MQIRLLQRQGRKNPELILSPFTQEISDQSNPTIQMKKRGILITFEGSEGCGKSTQIKRLCATLRKRGFSVITTREPGGTAVGERIRHLLKFSKANGSMVPESELLLFSASRAQLVREKILPAVQNGKVVLCDRFVDSTTVYQGIARKLNAKLIAQLNQFAMGPCKPNLTIVLDQDVSIGLSRARKKTKTADRMESQKRAFYEAVRKGFQGLAKREPRRIKLVDASLSKDEVSTQILSYVDRILS